MILAFWLGCGDPISNAFVDDDLVFLEALPDTALLRSPVAVPEGATAPALVGAAVSARNFELQTAYWRAVDQAVRTPGTLDIRDDDARRWDGLQVVFADGERLETRVVDVVVERAYSGGGEGFGWTVEEVGDATVRSVATGRSAGPLHEARWSLGDGTSLEMSPSSRFQDELTSVERVGANGNLLSSWLNDGQKHFGYGALLPILTGDAPVLTLVVVENDAEGGSGAGLVFDEAGACGAWHTCWDPAGTERFRAGDGAVATVGVASSCPANHPVVALETIRAACP